MLSKREKWLMGKAFQQGYAAGHDDTVESCYYPPCEEGDECFEEWLADMAGDGITVADELDKQADTH